MAVKKLGRARVSGQKSVRQSSKAKLPEKQKSKIDIKDRKALVVAQEIKFARLLASNDKRVRDKVLKNLKKWLTVRSESSFAFVEADFSRLWKGLFYCMWMSDKPLIQEELSESLSNIVHCFNTIDTFLLYTSCALKTLGREWYGIDQYRIDKFSMLVRRIFRQTFNVCKRQSWNKEWVIGTSDLLEKLLLSPQTNLGFTMHVVELCLEELSKVAEGNIPKEIVTTLVKPFVAYLVTINDEKQIKHVVKHIFRYLIFQSDIGLDYTEKFHAWRRAGYPSGSIDAMEKIEVGSDDENAISDEEETNVHNKNEHKTEKLLDPRAGRVDVELPQLDYNPEDIVKLLKLYRANPSTTAKARRQMLRLIAEFSELAEGKMPVGIKEVKLPIVDKKATSSKKGAQRLLELEADLYSDTGKKNKRKRKKNGLVLDDEDISDNEYARENKIDEPLMETKFEKTDIQDNTNKDKRKLENASSHSAKAITIKSDSVVKNLKKKLKKRKMDVCVDENVHFEKTKKQGITKLISIKGSNKVKKNKIVQNGIDHNKAASETCTKIKKSKQLEICGTWDISNNTAPAKPTKPVHKRSKIEINDNVLAQAENSKNQIPNQTTWLTSVLGKFDDVNNKPMKSTKESNKQKTEQSLKKRVKIVLQRNTAQNTSEYIRQIRQSPAIPFDANKKPLASALKANAIPSPVNPFYKRKMIVA